MTDTPGEQTGPTPEEVAIWTKAIHEIMERDGVTEEEANAGLIWALADAEIKEAIRDLARERDETLWASVIRDLMDRYPDWTEQEANDNLINLLRWVEEHPGEDFPPPNQ